jgi:mannose-6-phosphate isomerase
MKLTPLFFTPIPKERLWGGQKLRSFLNKPFEGNAIGESWELSTVPGDVSVVAEGPWVGSTLDALITNHKAALVGQKVYDRFGDEFPVLIKFIDAHKDLSIQLHPHDHLAKERHQSFGKNEMWYIMQADTEAQLIVGFSRDVEKADYQAHLASDSLEDILQYEPVQSGDTFYIRTGTVHAIGAGILLAEIQQTSDVTYRIYDWNRKDKDGNTRELHTDLAVDAIDYTRRNDHQAVYDQQANVANAMVDSPYFTTDFLPVRGRTTIDAMDKDSFVILMGVRGVVDLHVDGSIYSLSMGQTVLIPATLAIFELIADDADVLMVYIN